MGLIDYLDGNLAWYYAHPTRSFMPEGHRPDELPRTRVHVESQDGWIEIMRLLFGSRGCLVCGGCPAQHKALASLPVTLNGNP